MITVVHNPHDHRCAHPACSSLYTQHAPRCNTRHAPRCTPSMISRSSTPSMISRSSTPRGAPRLDTPGRLKGRVIPLWEAKREGYTPLWEASREAIPTLVYMGGIPTLYMPSLHPFVGVPSLYTVRPYTCWCCTGPVHTLLGVSNLHF